MKKKKLLSVILATAMVMSMGINAYASSDTEVEPRGGSTYHVKVLKEYGNVTKQDKYLTTSWTKSDSYSVTETYEVEYDYGGTLTAAFAEEAALELGLNVTYGLSVSSNIPADASRYSKLALFVEYTHQYVEVTKYYLDLGSEITKRGDLYTPVDSYIDVVYKS